MTPVVVLAIVFLLIALRNTLPFKLRIWQIMLAGAAAVLLAGQITPSKALQSIDADVLLFLFGMFTLGEALEESGYLAHVSQRFFRLGKSTNALVLLIIFASGVLAAFLMNDTLAIVGTPLLLILAKRNQISGKPLLLSLAFGITTGSVLSPIGNPQNLLIALNAGIDNPFLTFIRYLGVPTIINLAIVYFFLRIYYPAFFKTGIPVYETAPVSDRRLQGSARFL
jgi:Na+/H+ antiporter NhaD/arsenite permease-like protein